MTCKVDIKALAGLHTFTCPGLQDHLPMQISLDFFTKEADFLHLGIITRNYE